MTGHQITVRASRAPDAEAVRFGQRRLTYGALDQRSGRLAASLAERGIQRGDRVAVLALNCPQMLEILFAAARLGAIFVPINFRLVAREIALLMRACKPALLFAGQSFDDALGALRASGDLACPVLRINDRTEEGTADAEYEALLDRAGPPLDAVAAEAADPLLVMHSSGTTGLPKGAIHTHGTVLASCMAKIIDFGLTGADRAVVFGPLFHAGPLMDLALPLLLRGGSVVLGVSRGFDPETLLDTIATHGGTVAPVYPTMLRRVMLNGLGGHDLSRLRLIITGGEPIATSVLRDVQAALPHTDVVNNYGSTEGGPITTFLPGADSARKPGSVGRPSFGMQVRIADANGNAIPTGEVGEILVRGPFVCHGYWQRPDLTQQARRGAWWATGDLGRLDSEGYLWFAGRRTEMIKSGTENIYPGEVENVIMAMDGVAEVGVLGVPDEIWGERVAAYIVRIAGSKLDEAAVVTQCRAALAGYKIPRIIRFIDALPRSGTSKISRPALRAAFVAETNPDAAGGQPSVTP